MRRHMLHAVVVITGFILGASLWPVWTAPAEPVVRLVAALPEPLRGNDHDAANEIQGIDLAIAANGRHIVFAAGETARKVYVRALDQRDARRLEGIDGAQSLFIAPDGESVGYFEGDHLKTVRVDGSLPPGVVCNVSGEPRGASWSDRGSIFYATSDPGTGLMRVASSGGTPEVLTTPDAKKGEVDHVLPHVLPSGRAVVYTALLADGHTQLTALDLETGLSRALMHGGSHPQYVESGFLVYAVEGALWAVRFHASRLTLLGPPVQLSERIAFQQDFGVSSFGVAHNGTLVYAEEPARVTESRTVVWVDRKGREEPLPVPSRAYTYPRLSPDGSRLALDIRDGDNDIWIWNFAARTLSRITNDPGPNRGGIWSPDGVHLAFSGRHEEAEALFWQDLARPALPERLSTGARAQTPLSFTPDGKRLLYLEPDGATFNVGIADLHEHRQRTLFGGAHNELNAEVSPDGRWIAYESDESGESEVYVRPMPNTEGGLWRVSTSGGGRPAWARDGRELFYWMPPGKLVAVPIQPGASFSAGDSTVIVDGSYLAPQSGRSYDVTADGQRFIMIKDSSAAAAGQSKQLMVVLNWTQELKRAVPTR